VDIIFEKRAANFIRRYKTAYFFVKIGPWILTKIFRKTAYKKERTELVEWGVPTLRFSGSIK
jgi:hypothetical protein